jgi:hypothetical protein
MVPREEILSSPGALAYGTMRPSGSLRQLSPSRMISRAKVVRARPRKDLLPGLATAR